MKLLLKGMIINKAYSHNFLTLPRNSSILYNRKLVLWRRAGLKNNEKFVKYWERYRGKGKFKYMLIRCIIYTIVSWLTFIALILVEGNDLNQLTKVIHLFFGGLIGTAIVSPIVWDKNEERYYKLLENK